MRNNDRVYEVYIGELGKYTKTLFVSGSNKECKEFVKNSKLCQEYEICEIADYPITWLMPEDREMIRRGQSLNFEATKGMEAGMILNFNYKIF